MKGASEFYLSILSRLAGDGLEAAKAATTGVWFGRGVRDAAYRLDLTETDIEMAAPWAFGFESGAKAALRMATAILSDPAIKGMEVEALAMIEAGLGHAEVIAKLRASAPEGNTEGGQDQQASGIVVAFKARSIRP